MRRQKLKLRLRVFKFCKSLFGDQTGFFEPHGPRQVVRHVPVDANARGTRKTITRIANAAPNMANFAVVSNDPEF
jgi:hypothetical protein